MNQSYKSYRIYKSDHVWLKSQAAATKTSVLEVLKKVWEVQEKYSSYFEQALGLFSERTSRPVELETPGKVDAMPYSVPESLALNFEQFFYDELSLLGNSMSKVLLTHLLIDQYKQFVSSPETVLQWYRSHMPHVLEQYGE